MADDADEKKLKARARAKAWREANPERFVAAIAKCKAAKPEKYKRLHDLWRAANTSKVKEYRRKQDPLRVKEYLDRWVRLNPARKREIGNNWRKNNQEKVNAVDARRRAAKANAVPSWANHFFINEIYHLARLRTKHTGFKWHVDHIVPLTSKRVCGLHVEHNLQVIPASVNQSKNNRRWPDMA